MKKLLIGTSILGVGIGIYLAFRKPKVTDGNIAKFVKDNDLLILQTGKNKEVSKAVKSIIEEFEDQNITIKLMDANLNKMTATRELFRKAVGTSIGNDNLVFIRNIAPNHVFSFDFELMSSDDYDPIRIAIFDMMQKPKLTKVVEQETVLK